MLTTLGKGTEIVCYRNQVVDGNEYDNFILTTDISNMQKEKFGLIGDSCLGNRDYSLMRRMNLYGECHCIHSLFGSYYDEFRKRVDDVVNERNLIYRERYAKDKEFTFSQYCDKDNGTIITHIDEGRLHYYIKK